MKITVRCGYDTWTVGQNEPSELAEFVDYLKARPWYVRLWAYLLG